MATVNVREKSKSTRLSKELKDFIGDLRKKITRDDDARTAWKRKLVVATNQRMGLKRAASQPYAGAPNIPLPEADKQIRKRKPNYVLSVIAQKNPASIGFGPTVGEITPEMKEKRHRAEIGFNYVLKKEMNLLRTLTVASDQAQEKGYCLFKTIEDFRVENVKKVIDLSEFSDEELAKVRELDNNDKKLLVADRTGLDLDDDKEKIDDIIKQFNSGAEVIEYNEQVVSTMPKIIIRDPEDVVFPSYTSDIGQAERIADNMLMSERVLMERAISGAYSITKVKKAIKGGVKKVSRNEDDEIKIQKNNNEGITQEQDSDLYRVQEIYTWRPTGENGSYERWIFTILADVADDSDATIQVIRFPYEFNSWNWDKHDNEVRDNRPYSTRGVPEQIRALQEFMERSINNMVMRDEINNAPMFTVLSTSKARGNTIRFKPGQKVTVARHDEIQQLGDSQNKTDISSERIVQTLKAFAEEYLGSTDQLFRNSTNKGGGKTLGEIKEGVQQSANFHSLDLLLWNEILKSVYKKVWAILRSRLGEPLSVNGIIITKDDFDFDAEITPTGSVETLNKDLEIQKALNRVQLITQQIQLGLIVNAEDLYNAMEDFLEKDGVRDTERFITRPEVIQQERQQIAQQQQQVLAQQEQEISQEIAAKGG